MIIIRHRGKEVAMVADVDAALRWLLDHQPDSSAHAVTRAEYDVRDESGRRLFLPPRSLRLAHARRVTWARDHG